MACQNIQTASNAVFENAFNAYKSSLGEKKHQRKFMADCLRADRSPEAIQSIVQDAENKSSTRTSKRVAKTILQPLVDSLKAYDPVINALSQADPMPTALIWGSIKVVVDATSRYTSLFENISSQLQSLSFEVPRITYYNELYGSSSYMQQLLFESYINMFKFWHRVYKEIERSWVNTVLRSVAPFSTLKLSKIITSLKESVDKLERTAGLLEQGNAIDERTAAAQERIDQASWRSIQQNDRVIKQEDRKIYHYREVCDWLRNPEQSSISRHESHQGRCSEGTCEWLLDVQEYRQWADGKGSNVLWVMGAAGTGKSIVCSWAIEDISQSHPEAAVLFHFCSFDLQYSHCETLRSLGHQLFQACWRRQGKIPKQVLKYLTTDCLLPNNVRSFIETLIEMHPMIYIFIDGLDEERETARWEQACLTMNFLINLASRYPEKVKLWCSSQKWPIIEALLNTHPSIDLKDRDDDVLGLYFTKKLTTGVHNLEVEDIEVPEILQELKERSQGNFLWASLMIEGLQNCVNSAQMKELIEEGLPATLDEQYRKIFQRMNVEEREFASQIYSLVVYARRPLRFAELQEALWILHNPPSEAKLDTAFKPRVSSIKRSFPPFIEEDPTSDHYCRLIHSTVATFIRKHSDVLQDSERSTSAPRSLVTTYTLADVCLRYLCLDRYKEPLVCKADIRCDALGDQVENQHFLQYSAKYWDKHLDTERAKSAELSRRVKDFLDSPNFLTCLQCQNLWIQNHFAIHRLKEVPDRFKFLKRIFPLWFNDPDHDYRKDYRFLVHEWSHFLDCATCGSPKCRVSSNPGELDRIFWRTLGPDNFMSSYPDRYQSHLLSPPSEGLVHHARRSHEGLTLDCNRINVLQLHARRRSILEFFYFTWICNDNKEPEYQRMMQIDIDIEACNWKLYARDDPYGDTRTRVGRAAPIAFGPTCSSLRIGSQLLRMQHTGTETAILKIPTKDLPLYFEEFSTQDDVLVVTSRRKVLNNHPRTVGLLDQQLENVGADLEHLSLLSYGQETNQSGKDGRAGSNEEEKVLLAENSSSASSDYTIESSDEGSEGSLAETWSEASTEADDALIQEDDANMWEALSIEDAEDDDDDDESGDASGEDDSSSDDDRQGPMRHYRRYLDESDEEIINFGSDDETRRPPFGDDSSDEDDVYRRVGRATQMKKRTRGVMEEPQQTRPEASMLVYRMIDGGRVLDKILTWTWNIDVFLYDSPPVVHPNKSLIVWPVSRGDVLFMDYEAKTWFTRRLRPTTSHTRHVSVKCHFSDCGQYLHVAAIEAQVTSQSQQRKRRKQMKQKGRSTKDNDTPLPPPKGRAPLKLSVFVTTYRLSSSKPTRSQPTLYHRVKLNIGVSNSIAVTELPLTLTWRPQEVYLSWSADHLSVFRIELFPPNIAGQAESEPGKRTGRMDVRANGVALKNAENDNHDTACPVSLPVKPIFLPRTAAGRKVYFFPSSSSDPNDRHRIIIGGEPPGAAAATVSKPSDHTANPDGSERFEPPEHPFSQLHPHPIPSGQVIGLNGFLSPPLGFFVHDTRDFGGWRTAGSDVIEHVAENKGIGMLDRKVEPFDAQDDCDLEPYIF